MKNYSSLTDRIIDGETMCYFAKNMRSTAHPNRRFLC